ncbi:MAG: hypothetical protein ACTH2Q_02030 [Propionibacteriaceae bacterium]
MRRLVAGATCLAALVALSGCTGAEPSAPGSPEPSVQPTDQQPTDPQSPGEAPPSVDPSPAVTSEVPAPGGGDVSETVPVEEPKVLPAVASDEPVDVNELTIRITSLTENDVEAQAPREIGGRAVEVVVEIDNGSDAEVELISAITTAADEGATPLVPIDSASEPFRDVVAGGDTATARYVYSYPEGAPLPLTITVHYLAAAPVAVFVGDPS